MWLLLLLIVGFVDVLPMLLLLLLMLELAAEVSELAAFFNAAIDAFTSRCRADKSYMNHNISYIFVTVI